MTPGTTWQRLGRWRRSLGAQVLLLFVGFGLILTLVFVLGMQRAFGSGWRDLARPLVADYVDRLAAEIGAPPDPARAAALAERLPLTIVIDGPLVQWRSHPDLDPRDADEADGDEPVLRPAPPPHWHRRGASMPDGMMASHVMPPPWQRPHAPWWLLTRRTDDGHLIRFGIAGVPQRQRPRFIGWVTLAALLGFTLLAYARVRHLLRPLADVRAGTQRYGAGDFATPIPVRREDELGQLATQVNTMASQLKGMLDAKRALLLAISHELRSPLTRARLNAELAEPVDPAAWHPDERAAHAALLRDLTEMRDLVSDLLESERLASGHAALSPEPTDLAALVRTELAAAQAEGRLQLDLPEALPPLPLDRVRLRLLVRNLADNAVKHTPPGAPPPLVRLALVEGAAGRAIELSVRDHGPGVAPEHLAHLTEPFYRADAARQRATGGVGLGLYLCRLVAEAHRGQLTLHNRAPGLEAICQLPVPPGVDGADGVHPEEPAA